MAVRNCSSSSRATMMCRGATVSIERASEGPTRWVLISATTPPARQMPSQIAMYSGRFGISRQTVSSLRTP